MKEKRKKMKPERLNQPQGEEVAVSRERTMLCWFHRRQRRERLREG